MSLPHLPSRVIAEARILRRLGHSLAHIASNLGIDPEDLRIALGEPAWKDIPPAPKATNGDDSTPGPKARHA